MSSYFHTHSSLDSWIPEVRNCLLRQEVLAVLSGWDSQLLLEVLTGLPDLQVQGDLLAQAAPPLDHQGHNPHREVLVGPRDRGSHICLWEYQEGHVFPCCQGYRVDQGVQVGHKVHYNHRSIDLAFQLVLVCREVQEDHYRHVIPGVRGHH